MTETAHPPLVILFDGVCNLCNSSVNFIIDRDPKQKFSFAALQSDYGRARLLELGGDPDKLDSVVLVHKDRLYTKSRAALEVARRMRGLYPLAYVFIIIPPFIRNALYNWVARNRYRWFGERNECRMPTPELKSRFVGA